MITPETYHALGLSDKEYQKILDVLNREPTKTELAMFSVEWSEHCGYMSSRALLKTLPNTGEYATALGEDSGAVFVGDYAIVFKIESHNHPSQIEPFQGAGTGVGGILRDIFTANARPIASLNSLRFGDIKDPYTQHLVREVVRGIAWYGNCVGVPTVGGEVYFDKSYNGNCLVNAMSIGICKKDEIASAKAHGVGNSIMYVGHTTGRDGIGGCSVLASHSFDDGEAPPRPTVQVGDPFTEKCLIEATLEIMKTGVVVGIKDMGAAGLTCSIAEMAAAGGVGIAAVLDLVPRREKGMEAWEIMMSESQERMLVCVEKGKEHIVEEIFKKWNLTAATIGEVTDDGMVRISYKGEIEANVSAEALTAAPLYEHEEAELHPPCLNQEITYYTQPNEFDLSHKFLQVLASPNVCSRKWIYEQYDHMVQTNTVTLPGKSDAAVMRLKGTDMAIAATTDCNSTFCAIDPVRGTNQTIVEAAQNLISSGAKPIAVTNCLNFGDPNDPEAFAELAASIRTLGSTCRVLKLPVVSGNVSLYNQSPDGRINPTPTIGMIGVLDDVKHAQTQDFKNEGDIILLIHRDPGGVHGFGQYQQALGLEVEHYVRHVNLGDHMTLQQLMLRLNNGGLFNSVHDCSDGGLGVAVAESMLSSSEVLGVNITLPGTYDSALIEMFREAPHRYLVSCDPSAAPEIISHCSNKHIGIEVLGQVSGTNLIIRHRGNEFVNVSPERMKSRWEFGLEHSL